MNTETTVLDEGLYGDPSEPNSSNLASTGQRFANYLIDLIFIYIVNAGIMVVLMTTQNEPGEGSLVYNFIFLFVSPLYYIIAESNGGKTIGKMVTKTKVVNKQGEKPSFSEILIRTLCRIIPFEPFSAFNSSGSMWHDSLSKTYLIKTK